MKEDKEDFYKHVIRETVVARITIGSIFEFFGLLFVGFIFSEFSKHVDFVFFSFILAIISFVAFSICGLFVFSSIVFLFVPNREKFKKKLESKLSMEEFVAFVEFLQTQGNQLGFEEIEKAIINYPEKTLEELLKMLSDEIKRIESDAFEKKEKEAKKKLLAILTKK